MAASKGKGTKPPATPPPALLPEVTLDEWTAKETALAKRDAEVARAQRTERVEQIRRGYGRFTPELQDEFIAELERCGNITAAAKVCGIDRKTVYNAADADKVFAERKTEALAVYADKVRAKVGELATEGVLKPIWYQGRIVGYERVISERMLELEAKRVDPTYRDKDPNGAGAGAPQVNVQIVLPAAAKSIEEYVASLPAAVTKRPDPGETT